MALDIHPPFIPPNHPKKKAQKGSTKNIKTSSKYGALELKKIQKTKGQEMFREEEK